MTADTHWDARQQAVSAPPAGAGRPAVPLGASRAPRGGGHTCLPHLAPPAPSDTRPHPPFCGKLGEGDTGPVARRHRVTRVRR
jgi:hypothetical protein